MQSTLRVMAVAGSSGTFHEGTIVTGYPSDATEEAVQSNIVAAGYGKSLRQLS